MDRKKLSKILMYVGLGVLALSLILGIITLTQVVGYNTTEVPIPESEFTVTGKGLVQEAILKKNGHLNAVMGLTPWTISITIVGTLLVAVALILQIERKDIKVR